MEPNIKSEIRVFNCCVVCLQDKIKVHTETEVSDNVIKIYKSLVQDEITQLGSTTLELCDNCITTLQNIVAFRRQCLHSIGYLSGKLQFNVVYVENEGENIDEVQIKLEECFDEASLPLKVELEEVKNSSFGSRTNRKRKIRSPSPNPLLEQKAERRYKVRKKESKSKTKQLEKKREAAYCSICGEFFQRNLSKHIINFHTMHIENNQFKCNLCEEICKDAGVVMDHFYKHREFQEPKVCKVCELPFKNRKDYRVHVKSHNEKKSEKHHRQYPCDCCDASYASHTNLKYHVMSKHQGAMQCNYCNKAFFDKAEYDEHMKKEKDKIHDRKFYCDHCGYECKWKAALWLHLKKYHNPDEPLIICNECGKTYKTKNQFRMHQVSSHLEKTHQCSDCGKKFAFATTLRKHIRLYHTIEGMFEECKVCGKKLKSTSMRTHMSSVHQQLRKHKCDLCDMIFKTAGTLAKHKFSHTKTRPFNCTMCSTGYYQNEYLRKHFERVHGIVYTGADIRKICGKKHWEHLNEREQAQQNQ